MRANFVTDRRGVNNPNYLDGRKNTRLYSIYYNMITRCYNKKTSNYHRYGGRGIRVNEDWLLDFSEFKQWSMENGYQDNLTLDRINNDGDYNPCNCRWTTPKKQSRNRSTNHLVTLNNETKTLIDWCELYNINYGTVRDRLKRGWSYEKALLTQVDTRFRRKKVV